MFFSKKNTVFFFKKKHGKKTLAFLWSMKQNRNFCSKIMNASLKRKKKKKTVQSLFLLKTHTWTPYEYSPYKPGFDQPILKIFVINTDSLFAKYGKLTTR